jgi:hypothetical protein
MSAPVLTRLKPFFGPALALALLAAAVWAISAQLAQDNLDEIMASQFSETPRDVLLAFGLTAANFIVLAGYDILALSYIGHPLPPHRPVLASFAGNAFSNTIGLSTLAGSTVRSRLYSSWGLSTGENPKIVVFTTLTLWLGLFSIGGIIFTVRHLPCPTDHPALLHHPAAGAGAARPPACTCTRSLQRNLGASAADPAVAPLQKRAAACRASLGWALPRR